MVRKPTKPYIRDVFQAKLIKGARRTVPDGYPIIPKHMVATIPPKELYQWDRRSDVKNPAEAGMSFYCYDYEFIAILNNPQNYVEKLRKYNCVVGIDPSPYDNMPLVVQKSQIFNNLAITYYYGKQGLKVIPNVRLGNNDTIGALAAFPKETLIAIGTNGFMKKNANRKLFTEQVGIVVEVLRPTGIIVYGKALPEVFKAAIDKGISIYQFDSYTQKQNAKDRAKKVKGHEGV